MNPELLERYNQAVPRYTSYPAVPDWWNVPDSDSWCTHVRDSAVRQPISLYVHLPYCESLCTYCGCNTRITVNRAVEGPYIQSVLQEWALYRNLLPDNAPIREIHLGGGTPTFFSPQNLALLIDGLLQHHVLYPDADLSVEAHPANTTREHLQVLYSKGFRRLSLGIQDFDPEVQRYINRIQTLEQVRNITELARSIGYRSVNYDLIYGLPIQSRHSVAETVRLVRELKPDRIAFYSYAHVPWMRPAQASFDPAVIPTGQAKLDLYLLGRQLLTEAGYTDIGMDHFALPQDDLYRACKAGTMHRNFMGFTTFGNGTMIGLGASSISDTGTCLVQNAKTVEAYRERIQQGGFAFDRGHQLSRQEAQIRAAILSLMCTGQADVAALPADENVLGAMEADGLLTRSQDRIAVTEAGRLFVRNACSALDPYRTATSQNTFSKAI
jgi:oxygen-independent coproporphyrinogen-3 oxidase